MSFDPNDPIKSLQRIADLCSHEAEAYEGQGKEDLMRLAQIFQQLVQVMENLQEGRSIGLSETFLLINYVKTLQKIAEISKHTPDMQAVFGRIQKGIRDEGEEIIGMIPKLIEDLLGRGRTGGGFPDLGGIFNKTTGHDEEERRVPRKPRRPSVKPKSQTPEERKPAKKSPKNGGKGGGNFKL